MLQLLKIIEIKLIDHIMPYYIVYNYKLADDEIIGYFIFAMLLQLMLCS